MKSTAILIALAAAAPALAEGGDSKAQKKEQRFCKSEPTTATRMSPRKCLTAEQWRKQGSQADFSTLNVVNKNVAVDAGVQSQMGTLERGN